MSAEPRTMAASLRESRLILERLVQAAGAPPGMLLAARDCALYSAAVLPRGYEGVAAELAAFRASAPRPIAVSDAPDGTLVADCGGQHAWYAADAILDLAADALRTTGAGRVRAVNLASPDELGLLSGLAGKYGLDAVVVREGAAMTVSVSPRQASQPTVLERIRRDGIGVNRAAWWSLYESALEALAPDSFESRRHAGTVRVEADGTLVGRNDEDETDLSMLTPDVANVRAGQPAAARG